jgi:hypothetical protein
MENIIYRVRGQMTVIFKCFNLVDDCILYMYNQTLKHGLKVVMTTKSVEVFNINTGEKYEDKNNNSGLVQLHGAFYWISLDAQNQKLTVGVGEPRMETMIYQYTFQKEDKPFLENLIYLHKDKDSVKILKMLVDPITDKIPLSVKNTDDLTILDIAKQKYMPKSNLSVISQKLYDCISGKKFVLNDKDFPEFSDAIEYSIATKGLWCNTTLANKSKEFDKNKPNLLETYLRITLGSNNGESPGIPYVMEIWPPSHYSPIHNHANANAIIRVLHGAIHVKLFAFLCEEKDGIKPFAEADFKKDDITWISPTLNQTHQLVNTGKPTCITIQCYMYDEANKSHYDYFDYIDGDGNKQQYEPDSDMDFVEFRERMKKEWANRKFK